MNDPRKAAICNALAAFIRQRPGLEWANYATSNHRESVAAYRADQRSIARDKRDAEALLLAVRHNDGISADDILKAAQGAYSGRLSIVVDTGPGMTLTAHAVNVRGRPVRIDYCTGQYFPTEYRRAVAAVCASALWDWQRDNMPQRDGPNRETRSDGNHYYYFEPLNKFVSAGDWLRRKFRQDFGSALQKRWFD